jgi:hypothetical protein
VRVMHSATLRVRACGRRGMSRRYRNYLFLLIFDEAFMRRFNPHEHARNVLGGETAIVQREIQ